MMIPNPDWFKDYDPDEVTLIEKAIAISVMSHLGHKDKLGVPYIFHELRVMFSGQNEDEMVVGVSHDVVEDTGFMLDEYRDEEFPEYLIASIDAISHRKGETREEYYDRVKADELAYNVKEYDIDDNTQPARIFQIDDENRARLLRKYADAVAYLGYEDEESS